MKPLRKAVFPVAGLGTRNLPATKSVPKEMLPIVDRPLIQYAVDEALAAGIEQLIFVTGRGKGAMEDYFDISYELEATMRERGKPLDPLKGTRLSPGDIAYVRQQEPLGLGHAVWCARHLVGDEPFAVLLVDELLWSPASPSISQLAETYAAKGGNVISVLEVPDAHTHRYGIIDPGASEDDVTEVLGFVEKPRQGTAPSRLAAIGRYVLQPEVMQILDRGERGAGGEIQLTDALAQLIGTQPFHARTYRGARYDCGDKAGFVHANLALALEREDIGEEVRTFARSLLG
ncbi:MAG: UTP--glucose-1-phosphate uridylyltransferase [Proteobacteria bacterium]|nr:UTP--glucose-1-phosphate uridylyltransferase [Pseudomonadota bacterium]